MQVGKVSYVKKIACLILAAWCGTPSMVLADGGVVRLSEECGDYRITVFTSPTPLRAGPIDVSVLVQDAETGAAVDGADVIVRLTPLDIEHPPLRAVATTDQATNKLLRAALVELPAAGRWEARVTVREATAESPMEIDFPLAVGEPLPQWLSVWPWFSWPALVVLMYGVHRVLVARRERARRIAATPRHDSLPILYSVPTSQPVGYQR